MIESLRQSDLNTGQELFNDNIKYGLWKKGFYNHCEIYLPKSKTDFFNTVEKIKSEIDEKSIYPIIHLETHGSRDGIEVTNGQLITWLELQNRLIEINMLCKCNLFLTMATCYGGYIYSVINPGLRSPFWGFIGPFEEVSFDESRYNFKAFYDEFIDSLNINKAVALLNGSNESKKPKFRFHNTEFAFKVSYENYEKKYLTEEVIEERLEQGLIDARKHSETNHLSDEEIKRNLKFFMVDNKDFMKFKLMEKFFMWDLFPENRT
ncbi:MAG: hypothetical protein AAGB24_00975 [Bacteroidota bacterium]